MAESDYGEPYGNEDAYTAPEPSWQSERPTEPSNHLTAEELVASYQKDNVARRKTSGVSRAFYRFLTNRKTDSGFDD